MKSSNSNAASLLGGDSHVRDSIYSAIRSAARSLSDPKAGILEPDSRSVLDRIVHGKAPSSDVSAENILDLLAALQIPLETAIPVWPPYESDDAPPAQGLAAGGVSQDEFTALGVINERAPDEFFIRMRAVKEVFA